MTDSAMSPPHNLPAPPGAFPLRQIVGALMALDGSVGVLLGGSRSLGLARPDSDFDLVLVHGHEKRVSPEAIGRCLAAAGVAVVGVSAAGGLYTAEVKGRRFEVFQKRYRDLEQAVQQAVEGRFSWHMQPLFPHGSLSLLPVCHLAHNRLLAQRDGALSRLKQRVVPMPLVLQRALVQLFMTQATNACVHAAKVGPGSDRAHFMALLSLFVFSLNTVLFALGRQYPVLQKGGGILAGRLPHAPAGCAAAVDRLWVQGAAGDYATALAAMRGLLGALRPQVAQLPSLEP